MSFYFEPVKSATRTRLGPDGEIENYGKNIFEIRMTNFYYIQVIVFDFSYLPVAAVGT